MFWELFDMMRQAMIYGAIMAAAVFFVGWSTGMGGSNIANLAFSLAMGVFAGVCFIGAHIIAGRGKKEDDR